MPPARVAVLMTCRNRRALTERCLASLRGQGPSQSEIATLDLYCVDDGSSDGTADAVRAAWPGAMVIAGDGNLYWNGGMRLAWEHADRAGGYDHYMWLNDDVVLEPGAVARLLAEAEAVADDAGAAIVCGSTHAVEGSEVTYGGQRRPRRDRPLRFVVDPPGAAPRAVETVSGNIVLVTAAAFGRLGNLSPAFIHIFGDLDYGLRARVAGVPVYAGAGWAGACDGPEVRGTWMDPTLGRRHRLRLRWVTERTVHARDWRTFARRHAGLGPLSLVYAAGPYLRIVLGSAHPR